MEESDGETADSVWFGYECKSGEILFYYNQKTGEHRWGKDLCCSESNVIKVSISDLSGKHPSDVHSVGTQTEDYGCTNGCSSIYIHNEDHTVTSNRDESTCLVDRPSKICGVSVDDGDDLEQSETVIPNREDEDNVIDEEWNGGSEKLENDEDCILTDSCQSRGSLPENPLENEAICNEESDGKIQDFNFDSLMTDSCQSTQDVSDFIKDGKFIGNRNRVFENPCRFKMTAVDVRLEDMRYNLNILDENSASKRKFIICLEKDCSSGFCEKNTSESTEESPVNGSCESTMSCASPQNVIKCLEDGDYKRQETERDCEVSDSYKSTDLSSSAPGDLPSTECPQKKIKKSRNDSAVEHDKGFGSKNKDCDENGKDKDMNKKHKKSKHGRKVSIQAKNQRRDKKVNENVSRETYCDKQFALKRYPQNHRHNTGENTGGKPFKCSHCGKAFSQNSDLIRHIRTHTGEKPYKCSHCKKAFLYKSFLNSHIQTHTGEKPFKCSYCSKAFSRKSNLNLHIRMHTGDKPFKCSHCDKAFSHKLDLIRHIRTHTGEKPFKCLHCGKAFSQKPHLKYHVRTHTGEKPFECLQCGKAFSLKCNLNSHITKHTGIKAYKCSHCKKAFLYKSNLNSHIRTHTGEKPFKCSHCGKAFSRKSNLNLHIRMHTGDKPFKCSHCDKAFSHKLDLIRHIRTHTGEKPFKCLHCGKAFSQKPHLKYHVRTHTGEKPFECLQCGKGFSLKCNLNRHITKHIGIKPIQVFTL